MSSYAHQCRDASYWKSSLILDLTSADLFDLGVPTAPATIDGYTVKCFTFGKLYCLIIDVKFKSSLLHFLGLT
jgi:hypothetical protein